MEKNKNILYIAITVVITVMILSLLYFYNKGKEKNIAVSIHLTDTIDLNLSQIYVKPFDQSRNYVIFYAEAKNKTNKISDFSQYLDSKVGENQWMGFSEYLKLRTPDNQVCTMNNFYTLTKGVENIGWRINGQFEANESRFGYLVFECPKVDTNKYIINYENQNIETGF